MAFADTYKIRFTNNATTFLQSELLSAQTVLHLANGTGKQFPDIDKSKDEYFMLCLINPVNNDWEIVKVIERFHGDTNIGTEKDDCRVLRAQEGTTAKYFPGAVVR